MFILKNRAIAMDNLKEKFVDVAIIGAGVSGLYSGWRLLTGDRNTKEKSSSLKVKIFERSSRTGGRLQTVHFKEMPHVNVELGGMRYKKSHKLVSNLCSKALNLETEDFQGDTDFYFIRNKSLRDNDFRKDNIPYSLNNDEKNKTPDELFEKMWKDISGLEKLPRDRHEWYRIKQSVSYKGKRLSSYGFWNVILDKASNECVKLLRDTDGYDSNLVNWNAAEAFEAQIGESKDINVGESNYYCLRGGYEMLPKELEKRFKENGGEVELETELLQFKLSQREDIFYSKKKFLNELGFVPKFELKFKKKNEERREYIYANKIILAIPRQAIKRLNQYTFYFNPDRDTSDPQYFKDMNSIKDQEAIKVFMCYDYPWWKDYCKITHRKTITDLPLRQIYYFDTEGDLYSNNSDNRNSLLMAVYSDQQTFDFWDVLEKDQKLPDDEENESDRFMINFIHRQIVKVHQELYPKIHLDIDPPRSYSYKKWSLEKHGGSYHVWKPNTSPSEIMKRMIKPNNNFNVFLVGSSFSPEQAWVEGALNSTEYMLNRWFGVHRPSWLPKDYFLGYEE